MKKRIFGKAIAVFLTALMFAGAFGACATKSDDTKATASVSKVSATTAAAAKTTVKAATAAATAGVSKTAATTTGVASAGTVTTAPSEQTASEVIVDDDEISEQFRDVQIDLDQGFAAGNIDFGGRTIVYAAWANDWIPREGEGVTAEIVLKYLRIKAAEKKYNFKFATRVITPQTLYNSTFINETLAGITFADVYRSSNALSFPGHVKQNLILPLDEYIDYSSPIVKANAYMTTGSYWVGKHYGITTERENTAARILYNKDIIDREGQPDILDLVEKDQWNWQTFLDIAISCTRDVNGDGITDQWGLTSPSGFANNLTYNTLVSNGITCVNFDLETGKPVFTLTWPSAQRALQFASDLNFVYKVHKENGGVSTLPLYKNGQAAMGFNHHNYNYNFLQAGINSLIAPAPKGPDVNQYQSISACIFDVIPVNCKDPRDVSRMWMEVCIQWDEDGNRSAEYQKLIDEKLPYGFDWSTANPTRRYTTEREFLLVIKPLWAYKRTDYSTGYPSALTNLILNQVFNPVLKGEKSVSQAVDQIKEEAASIIMESTY